MAELSTGWRSYTMLIPREQFIAMIVTSVTIYTHVPRPSSLSLDLQHRAAIPSYKT